MQIFQRTNSEIEEIYVRNVDMVYRVCFLFFRGMTSNIEDAVQATFLKLMKNSQVFRDFEHEKAWLIVTASNTCKDMLSAGWSRHIRLDEKQIQQSSVPFKIDETLECVMALPEKYKTAIYMFYYEGYTAKEIARRSSENIQKKLK